MAALESYLWAFGLVSKATLQGNTAYNIENFPVQADQVTPLLGWKAPQREGTLRPYRPRIVQAADYSRKADGGWKSCWCLPLWTQNMLTYILTNQWPNDIWSADATMQTWNESVGGYSVYQCTALRPVPNEDYTIIDGMHQNVKIRFEGGILL